MSSILDSHRSLALAKVQLFQACKNFSTVQQCGLMQVMTSFFSPLLKLLSDEEYYLSPPISIKSALPTIQEVTQALLSVSSQLSLDLSQSSTDITSLQRITKKRQRHLTKKIALLKKLSFLNFEVWLLDFLSELQQILQTSQNLLLEKSLELGLVIDPEWTLNPYTSLDYEEKLSSAYLQIDPSTTTKCSSLRSSSSITNKKVSFSENLTSELSFYSHEPIDHSSEEISFFS